MNENNAIASINNAAGVFCEAYRKFGTDLNNLGEEIAQLEELIKEKRKKYNIKGSIPKDFFSDNNITIESYYAALSQAEKYKDDNGNVVPFNLLSDGERQELEAQVKQMNSDQGDVKLEIVTMKADIDRKSAAFERLIAQNREKIRIANERFSIERQQLESQKKKINNQIEDYELSIKRVGIDPAISNKTKAIADYRKQIAVLNVQKAIIGCVAKSADVYTTVFTSILASITKDMYEKAETIGLQDQFKAELTIANDIQDLVDGFRVIKDNYSAELDKISAIELSISEFKKNYEGVANANEFIAKANAATKALRSTIKQIENSKELDKAKTDEFGNVISENQPKGPENNPQGPENNPQGPENDPQGPENDPQGPENNPQGPENNPQGPENNPQGPENNPQGPENNPQGPENNPNGPENNPNGPQNNGGQAGNGVSDDVKDIMKRAKRIRSAKRMKAMKVAAPTFALALAAAGLSFLPPLAPISTTVLAVAGLTGALGAGYVVGTEFFVDLIPFAKYQATSHKLNSIARYVTRKFNKKNKKSGIKFKVRPVPETGELRFAIVKNGEDVGLIDSKSTGIVIGDDYSLNQDEIQSIVGLFQEQLDKKFKKFNAEDEKKRGDYQKHYNLPRITVDNLPVLYTEFGGYNMNLEGEQFGMMDTVKYRKAHKEGKGIKSKFKGLGKKIKGVFSRKNKDDLEEDIEEELEENLEENEIRITNGDLPPLNPAQEEALDDAIHVGSQDSASQGEEVFQDEINRLLAQMELEEDGYNRETEKEKLFSGLEDYEKDGIFAGVDEDIEAARNSGQNPSAQSGENKDSLNDVETAKILVQSKQQFGLDDVELASLQNDLNRLTPDQMAQISADLAGSTDKNDLFNAIDQVVNPDAQNRSL